MEYVKPVVMLIKFDYDLLSMSGSGPDATSIGSPSVEDDVKGYSVWDEVKQFNHKEESHEIYE